MKTKPNHTTSTKPQEDFFPLEVGEIIRLKEGETFRVWRVKGVHYSGMGTQDLVTLEALDMYNGTAFGYVILETQVPIVFLKNIPHLGRL